MLVDDSVQDKRYSQFIELVKLQYSGAEHGLVRGIGIVNLVHSAGDKQDFYPIDYRIYAPDQDGKTKNEHFSEMVINIHLDEIDWTDERLQNGVMVKTVQSAVIQGSCHKWRHWLGCHQLPR
jgi:hypothetical protein